MAVKAASFWNKDKNMQKTNRWVMLVAVAGVLLAGAIFVYRPSAQATSLTVHTAGTETAHASGEEQKQAQAQDKGITPQQQEILNHLKEQKAKEAETAAKKAQAGASSDADAMTPQQKEMLKLLKEKQQQEEQAKHHQQHKQHSHHKETVTEQSSSAAAGLTAREQEMFRHANAQGTAAGR